MKQEARFKISPELEEGQVCGHQVYTLLIRLLGINDGVIVACQNSC